MMQIGLGDASSQQNSMRKVVLSCDAVEDGKEEDCMGSDEFCYADACKALEIGFRDHILDHTVEAERDAAHPESDWKLAHHDDVAVRLSPAVCLHIGSPFVPLSRAELVLSAYKCSSLLSCPGSTHGSNAGMSHSI